MERITFVHQKLPEAFPYITVEKEELFYSLTAIIKDIAKICTAQWFDSLTVADQMSFYAELKDFEQEECPACFSEMIHNLKNELLEMVRQSIKDQKHTFHSYVLFLELLDIPAKIVVDFYMEVAKLVHLDVVGWTAQFIGKRVGIRSEEEAVRVCSYAGKITGVELRNEMLIFYIEYPTISCFYFNFSDLCWKTEPTRQYLVASGEVTVQKI